MNAKPVFALVTILFALTALAQPQEPAPTLTLIGVAGEVEDARWADHRVGHAIAELLTDGLFDNFVLMEEQPELFARRGRIAEQAWRQGDKPYDFEDDLAVFGRAGADYLAFARVTMSHSPWLHGRHGVHNHRLMRADITVRLTLIDTITEERTTAIGHAIADADTEEMVFIVQGDRVRFGETALGLATRAAVRNALRDLVPYRAGF